jgi:hypothetical protein
MSKAWRRPKRPVARTAQPPRLGLSSQLSDPKAEEVFNAARKSSDEQARVEPSKTAIINAAKEIDALLTDVVSPPVRDSVVEAFLLSSPPRTGRGVATFAHPSWTLRRNSDQAGSDGLWYVVSLGALVARHLLQAKAGPAHTFGLGTSPLGRPAATCRPASICLAAALERASA